MVRIDEALRAELVAMCSDDQAVVGAVYSAAKPTRVIWRTSSTAFMRSVVSHPSTRSCPLLTLLWTDSQSSAGK